MFYQEENTEQQEFKVLVGDASKVQKTLNQWRHGFHIRILGMTNDHGTLTLVIGRDRKSVV